MPRLEIRDIVVPDISRDYFKIAPFSIHRYLCDLFQLSYVSLFSYLLWSCSPFIGILVLIYAELIVYLIYILYIEA